MVLLSGRLAAERVEQMGAPRLPRRGLKRRGLHRRGLHRRGLRPRGSR
jgi:hypothetical protein